MAELGVKVPPILTPVPVQVPPAGLPLKLNAAASEQTARSDPAFTTSAEMETALLVPETTAGLEATTRIR